VTGWMTDELRPKSGMILTVESHALTFDSPYFREGDVVKVAQSGAAAIIHDIAKEGDGYRAQFSTGVYRHIDYIDRIEIDHDCRRNDCQWEVDEDGDDHLWHDRSNDYKMLALPYYVVRFTKVGDTVINLGAAYVEGSKLDG
jgi:hypothetical protein